MTTREIQAHLVDLYGAEMKPTPISQMTDKVAPLVSEWRSRPLPSVYARVSIDGIREKESTDGRMMEKGVYGVMGLDIDGHSDRLGLWMLESETAKGWVTVFTALHYEASVRCGS